MTLDEECVVGNGCDRGNRLVTHFCDFFDQQVGWAVVKVIFYTFKIMLMKLHAYQLKGGQDGSSNRILNSLETHLSDSMRHEFA